MSDGSNTLRFDATLEEIADAIGDDNIIDSILTGNEFGEIDFESILQTFDDTFLQTLVEHYDEDNGDDDQIINPSNDGVAASNMSLENMEASETPVDKCSFPRMEQVTNHSLEHQGVDEFKAVLDGKESKKQTTRYQGSSPLNKIYPRHNDMLNSFSFDPLHNRPLLTHHQQLNTAPTVVRPSFIQYATNTPTDNVSLQQQTSTRTTKYRDLSTMTDEEALSSLNYTHMRGRAKEPFPVKLHSILECSERDGYASIISWMPHGRAFKIHSEDIFVERIMPRYFFQSKMSSFLRQLRGYCFHKIKGQFNVDRGAYFHELFLRGRPGLCRGIVRVDKPIPLDKRDEPNLYQFHPMPSSNHHVVVASCPDIGNASMNATTAPRIIQYSNFSTEETSTTSSSKDKKKKSSYQKVALPSNTQNMNLQSQGATKCVSIIKSPQQSKSCSNVSAASRSSLEVSSNSSSIPIPNNSKGNNNNSSIMQIVRNITTPSSGKRSSSYNSTVKRVFTL